MTILLQLYDCNYKRSFSQLSFNFNNYDNKKRDLIMVEFENNFKLKLNLIFKTKYIL